MKCGTTHYHGCECHEAKRDAEIERLTRALSRIADPEPSMGRPAFTADDLRTIAREALRGSEDGK